MIKLLNFRRFFLVAAIAAAAIFAVVAPSLAIDEENLPTNVDPATVAEVEGDTAIERLFPNTPPLKTLKGATWMADETVIIDEDVKSDLFVAGETIIINADVYGDLFAAGYTVTVNGTVHESARIGAGTVTINGTIGRNALIAGETITVSQDAVIEQHANLFGATVVVEGQIERTLESYSETAFVNGTLADDAKIEAVSASFGANAKVDGDVQVVADEQPSVHSSTEGAEGISYEKADHSEYEHTEADYMRKRHNNWFMSFLFYTVIGLLIITASQKWVEDIRDSGYKYAVESSAAGMLTVFLIPVISIIIAFTLIGLPVTFVMWVGLVIVLMFAKMVSAAVLGYAIAHTTAKNARKQLMIEYVVGLFLLTMIGTVPVVGWFVSFLAGVFGLGVLVYAKRRAMKK